MQWVECPYPCPCEAWRFSLAAPMLPDGAAETASRPGGRLAERTSTTRQLRAKGMNSGRVSIS